MTRTVAPSGSTIVRVGQLNLCRTNTPGEIFDDLVEGLSRCDFLVLNEHEGNARGVVIPLLRANRDTFGWYCPKGAAGAVVIVHRRATVTRAGRGISRMTHKGVRGVTPNRYANRRAYRVRGWGRRLCLIGTHAVNGYTKPWKFPTTIGLRRALSRTHWATTARVTRWARRWCAAVVLGGDTNGALRETGPAYMPGPALAELYTFDVARGFDHVCVAEPRRGQPQRARLGKRRTYRVNSDHPFVVQEIVLD